MQGLCQQLLRHSRLSRISLRLNELRHPFLKKTQGHRRFDQEKQKTDPPVARVSALTDKFGRCGWLSFKISQSDFLKIATTRHILPMASG